jgi:hypothetical protein
MPELPVGWRWESYGGVEVGVPDSWGWGNGGQRLGQWFLGNGRLLGPIVGRPGVVTLAGRRPEPGETVDPGTLVKNTGEVVSFSRPLDDTPATEHEGDRTTARLAGVEVVVQARDELRPRIVATIHAAEIDHNGCPSTHPVGSEPARRPQRSIDVTTLTGVTSMVAAKYGLQMHPRMHDSRIESSLRLDGVRARDAVAAICRARLGGGPNNASDGMPAYSYGDEMVVLTITSDQGRSEVYLRYAGTDHNGFDDGVNVRRLTVEAVAPFLAGPNAVYGALSSGAADIVWADRPRAPS